MVSVSIRSGSKLARASRPAATGNGPIGWHSSSPSPRKASASATRQISSMLASLTAWPPASLTARPRLGSGRRSRLRSPGQASPVVLVRGQVEPVGLEPGPGLRVPGRGRVLPLERLVPAVVGQALGEVGASTTPSVCRRGIFSVWTDPSFSRSSVATSRSHDMNVRPAAMANRSSKYRSGPRNCPLPAESARFMCTSDTSISKAGTATSSVPSP